jgi:hypothetical protein
MTLDLILLLRPDSDTLNLECEEEILATTLGVISLMLHALSLEGEEEILATTLGVISLMLHTLNLEGEEEILATTLGVISPIPDTLSLGGEEEILATTLGAISPIPDTLSLEGEETLAMMEVMPGSLNLKCKVILEGEEMMASPVPTLVTLLEVVSRMNLESEEMSTHITTPEGSDSDSDAAACPTTTSSLKPTKPTTNVG